MLHTIRLLLLTLSLCLISACNNGTPAKNEPPPLENRIYLKATKIELGEGKSPLFQITFYDCWEKSCIWTEVKDLPWGKSTGSPSLILIPGEWCMIRMVEYPYSTVEYKVFENGKPETYTLEIPGKSGLVAGGKTFGDLDGNKLKIRYYYARKSNQNIPVLMLFSEHIVELDSYQLIYHAKGDTPKDREREED